MAKNKIPYRAKLVNGMYKVKKSRVKNISASDLESLVKKEVKETNRRLKQLEKPIDLNKAKYNPKTKKWERPNLITFTTPSGKKRKKISRLKNFKGEYASKRLKELGLTKKGRVKLTGKESRTELINLHTELNKFLRNITSTRSGVLEVYMKSIESLGLNLDLEPEESGALYNVFFDEDFKIVQPYVKGSDYVALMNDSISKNKSEDEFIDVIRDYISEDKLEEFGQDLDVQNALKRIYNKYKLGG